MISDRQPVSEGARLGAWFILILLWLGTIGRLAIDRSDISTLLAAVLVAVVGTAVFLPVARGSVSPHWFTLCFALGGILYLTNELEATLAGPAWWYAAAVVLCLGFALSPLRTLPARVCALGSGGFLVWAGFVWWDWRSTDASSFERLLVVSWLLLMMMNVTAAIRSRVLSPPHDRSGRAAPAQAAEPAAPDTGR